NYSAEYYQPLIGDWVLRLKGNLGYGGGYGGTSELPFFQNFFAGGLSSAGVVRGYDENSLGPRSTNPREYIFDNTRLLRDEQGNIVTDESGHAMIDPNGAFGIMAEHARDASGNLRYDANGNPVYQLAANERQLNRELDAFGGNI